MKEAGCGTAVNGVSGLLFYQPGGLHTMRQAYIVYNAPGSL